MFNRFPPRRLWCLLLTLVLVVSVLPVNVFAEDLPDVVYNDIISVEEHRYQNDPEGYKSMYVTSNMHTYDDAMAFANNFLSQFKYKGENADAFLAWATEFYAKVFGVELNEGPIIPHVHAWTPDYNRTHHFQRCTTGCDEWRYQSKHNHDGENRNCTCGYEFEDNCGLTTLYLYDMVLSPAFDPEVTEYTATPVHYKEVTKTWITAFKFDDLSTLELPEDLTVEPGKTFTVKVTAEDLVTTREYKITVAE